MCLRTDAVATKRFMRRNGHKEKILVYKFVKLKFAEPWKPSVGANI